MILPTTWDQLPEWVVPLRRVTPEMRATRHRRSLFRISWQQFFTLRSVLLWPPTLENCWFSVGHRFFAMTQRKSTNIFFKPFPPNMLYMQQSTCVQWWYIVWCHLVYCEKSCRVPAAFSCWDCVSVPRHGAGEERLLGCDSQKEENLDGSHKSLA